MLPHPIIMEDMIKYRQQRFIEEAQQERLMKQARRTSKMKKASAIERFADVLISFGTYLKIKYGHQPCCMMKDSSIQV